MSNETLFYICGIVLAVSAVVVSFVGLKVKNFPGQSRCRSWSSGSRSWSAAPAPSRSCTPRTRTQAKAAEFEEADEKAEEEGGDVAAGRHRRRPGRRKREVRRRSRRRRRAAGRSRSRARRRSRRVEEPPKLSSVGDRARRRRSRSADRAKPAKSRSTSTNLGELLEHDGAIAGRRRKRSLRLAKCRQKAPDTRPSPLKLSPGRAPPSSAADAGRPRTGMAGTFVGEASCGDRWAVARAELAGGAFGRTPGDRPRRALELPSSRRYISSP